MRKANKIPFIITLTISLLFIIGTVLLLFIPEPKPLKITEPVTFTENGGVYTLGGKIKNVSKEAIVIGSRLEVEVSAQNESGNTVEYVMRPNGSVTLEPNEEYDLSAISQKYGNLENFKINKIRYIVPEHAGVVVYGNIINTGSFSIYAFLSGLIGVVLLIVAIVAYKTYTGNVKRVNNIISQIQPALGGGVYAEAYFGNRAQDNMNTAKTTVSFIYATIFATLFGFGRYKVYSRDSKKEFIITENSIYAYRGDSFDNVTNGIVSAFTQPKVIEKSNAIIVKGVNKNAILAVKAKKGSAEKAEILRSLQNIFGTATEEKQG